MKKMTITYKNRVYDLVFNLNVIDEIQKKYGTLNKWVELTEGDEPNAEAVKFGFTHMINEGIDIFNEDNNDNIPFMSEKQVARLITELGLQEISEKMQDTVINSVDTGEEKN